MKKEIIDLQFCNNSICAIILTNECKNLKPSITMNANVSNKFLFNSNLPPFADKLNSKAKNNEICYFIIYEIDKVNEEMQNKFVELVKDREFNGYTLPNNVIVVFSVENAENLKKFQQV